MAQNVLVRLPPHLRRYMELPAEVEVSGNTVRELLDEMESRFPGFAGYVLHENGSLRQHVNIFLGSRVISDRIELSDPVTGIGELFVMQALSGG